MGQVLNLNPERDIEEFCEFLYGAESGFVYVPTKSPDSGSWETHFFEWPQDKQQIVEHVTNEGRIKEVYIGPALYTAPDTNVSNVRGARVVWAEFDGKTPSKKDLGKLPEPTLRVRSSNPGHEHWYWKLDRFCIDLKWLQDTNRGLAYTLQADLSGWDVGQVLRPVGTFNHKRGALPVTVLSQGHTELPRGSFNDLPPIEEYYSLDELNTTRIPKAEHVIFKYEFLADERTLLLQASIKEGSRSSALTKAAFICARKGMDNSEVYAMLQWCDSRWGKYRDRRDKAHCYLSLVNFVRQKVPYETLDLQDAAEEVATTDPELAFEMLGMVSHINQVDDVKWIIPGILHDTSVVYFVGESESYKSMITVELGLNLALGVDMLDWKIAPNEDGTPRQFRIGMFSLEMSGPELNDRYVPILNRYPSDVQEIIEKNFLTYSNSEGLRLYDPVDVDKLRGAIKKYKLDGIILDSAQMAFSPNMSDEQFTKKSTTALQRIRHELGVFAFVVHHPRKDMPGVNSNSKRRKISLSDLFGSQVLQNSASTVIQMTKLNDRLEDKNPQILINYLKMRFNKETRPADMTIEVLPDLTFKRAVIGEIASEPTAMLEQAEKLKPKNNGPNGNLDI